MTELGHIVHEKFEHAKEAVLANPWLDAAVIGGGAIVAAMALKGEALPLAGAAAKTAVKDGGLIVENIFKEAGTGEASAEARHVSSSLATRVEPLSRDWLMINGDEVGAQLRPVEKMPTTHVPILKDDLRVLRTTNDVWAGDMTNGASGAGRSPEIPYQPRFVPGINYRELAEANRQWAVDHPLTGWDKVRRALSDIGL